MPEQSSISQRWLFFAFPFSPRFFKPVLCSAPGVGDLVLNAEIANFIYGFTPDLTAEGRAEQAKEACHQLREHGGGGPFLAGDPLSTRPWVTFPLLRLLF